MSDSVLLPSKEFVIDLRYHDELGYRAIGDLLYDYGYTCTGSLTSDDEDPLLQDVDFFLVREDGTFAYGTNIDKNYRFGFNASYFYRQGVEAILQEIDDILEGDAPDADVHASSCKPAQPFLVDLSNETALGYLAIADTLRKYGFRWASSSWNVQGKTAERLSESQYLRVDEDGYMRAGDDITDQSGEVFTPLFIYDLNREALLEKLEATAPQS